MAFVAFIICYCCSQLRGGQTNGLREKTNNSLRRIVREVNDAQCQHY